MPKFLKSLETAQSLIKIQVMNFNQAFFVN